MAWATVSHTAPAMRLNIAHLVERRFRALTLLWGYVCMALATFVTCATALCFSAVAACTLVHLVLPVAGLWLWERRARRAFLRAGRQA